MGMRKNNMKRFPTGTEWWWWWICLWMPLVFLIISHCISFYLILSHCISLYLIVSHFISFYLIVSHCLPFWNYPKNPPDLNPPCYRVHSEKGDLRRTKCAFFGAISWNMCDGWQLKSNQMLFDDGSSTSQKRLVFVRQFIKDEELTWSNVFMTSEAWSKGSVLEKSHNFWTNCFEIFREHYLWMWSKATNCPINLYFLLSAVSTCIIHTLFSYT